MPWTMQKGKGVVHPLQEDKDSKLGSTASMSASYLNEVIMDMLSVNPTANSCQISCRADTNSLAGQRNQMVKMLIIILIPIITLLGLAGNTFGLTIDNYVTAKNIRDTLRFSLEMSYMVKSLQRERDASALYLSAISPETKGFLLKRYQETDDATESLQSWPSQLITSSEDFESSELFLKMLNRHRYELDTLAPTFQEELHTYSEWIEVFIRWFFTTSVEAKSDLVRTIWKMVVSYQELLVASEHLGRERAMGVIFYNRGYFKTREEYLYFAEAQDTSNASFASARLYSDLAREIFDTKLTENAGIIEQIQTMRVEVKARSLIIEPNGSVELANAWFDNMTYYQDIVLEIMVDLAKQIDGNMADRQRADLINIIAICLLFSMVIIISPIIVYSTYSLTLDIQSCSVQIADRTKELNNEKKRTDTLLYQMLPKTVAEKLKKKEVVGTEEFHEATIMFSDIVGFTKISSTSSPIQIVEMLNMIYTSLDDYIEMYDVYKVETIGDAYLVVSGVPKLNGNLHAAEIASLSLDIMAYVNGMDIIHIPGTSVKLRIGIHSGPVVAGIVGTKMPHYCVLGESVNIAARIEALGLPCKIHMTEATKHILDEIGGYFIESREQFPNKDDDDLVMAFRGDLQTYWLVGKEGHTVLDSDSSSCYSLTQGNL